MSIKQYPCTECGADATLGLSGWSGPDGQAIGKDERLCGRCAAKRGISWPFGLRICKPKERGNA